MADTLPEGTDHILPGAAETSIHDGDPADLRAQASAKAAQFKDQAGDKARDYAEQGKARASGALDEVARLITQNASQVDDKIGEGYGDYVRRAADAVSGFAGTLREKDVDDLIDEARDLVRRSPAIAIGAAAAAGFVIARIVKAGADALQEQAKAAEPTPEPVRRAPAKASPAKTGSKTSAKSPPKRKPRATDG